MTAHTIDWIKVFTSWLGARPALDRIDFPMPSRFPGQTRAFEYNGPMHSIRSTT